jgi:CD109 antigen
VVQITNGIIRAGQALDLVPAVPDLAVQGSARAFLNVTPSPVAQSMKGVSDLLQMPYGCGEQNMIFLAPDIEILKYLREIAELAPEIRAKAEHFANVGYQRQLTFQTDDGGFAAFGGKTGSLWLTAFVLSTFSGAREVRDIDETILGRAARMLLSRQNADGSFLSDRFLIHTEMEGGVDNIYALTAYVTNALVDYGGQETASALAKAAAYLSRTDLLSRLESAYPLAIAAVALQKVPGFESTAEVLIDRLLQLALRDGAGIHWKPYPVETTGYAAIALLLSNGGQGRPEAQSALEWLSTQRNALGGYGRSTQDTVVALRALFVAARRVHRDVNLELTLLQAGQKLSVLRIDASNFDLSQQVEVPVSGGSVVLRAAGTGSVGYQLVTEFNVPGDFLPPPRDLLLDISYNTGHIEVDNLVDVNVSVTYTGVKDRTGMIIADIGVPTGFEVVRASLDALLNQKIVQRAELAGRKIIFYIDSMPRAKPLTFTFQIKALYPVRAEGALAKAYEYYDASVQAYVRQAPVSFGMARPRSRP